MTTLTRDILVVVCTHHLTLQKAYSGSIAHIWEDDAPLCGRSLVQGDQPEHNVVAGKDKVCDKCLRCLKQCK